jgi:hypothetical protein
MGNVLKRQECGACLNIKCTLLFDLNVTTFILALLLLASIDQDSMSIFEKNSSSLECISNVIIAIDVLCLVCEHLLNVCHVKLPFNIVVITTGPSEKKLSQ